MTLPELESQITTYLELIEERFKELSFEEPTIIPDVFLKEFKDAWSVRIWMCQSGGIGRLTFCRHCEIDWP